MNGEARQKNGLEVHGSPLCLRVSEQRGSPLCVGLSWKRLPHMKVHPPHAHRAAGKAEPALGSFPGMGFLGEVPAGKGRSLNRWGRPTAFLEGNSSDSPCGHPQNGPCAYSRPSSMGIASPGTQPRALPESPHLQGTGQENWTGGVG